MSLKIVKAGILDTVQDGGRWGYRHLGINPGGAMDRFSASLAGALLGKEPTGPVIELHFPASQILFQKPCVVCLTGADFSPAVSGASVPLNQPFFVAAGAVLSFTERVSGARCYLSLLNELSVDKWLNGYGTNLKAGAGGYKGRRLRKDDVLECASLSFPKQSKAVHLLPWRYREPGGDAPELAFVPGREWDWLTARSQRDFLNNDFFITPASDRMGYRLQGNALEQKTTEQLISSAVGFGTVQLLPNGGLIVLMADHPTTGGYPRIGHVIGTHLSRLAQKRAGESLKFATATLADAEEKWVKQQGLLTQLRNAGRSKLQTWLYANRR